MSKALCWVGMVLSLVVFLIFLVDLCMEMPFQRYSIFMDIVFMAASAVMIWLGWGALREQK
ncbi:MAG: hypothetical protein Q4D98_01885 [Planctomycetia bacterium]|nr:hypothetical protein [Planctomycetia bacterium]